MTKPARSSNSAVTSGNCSLIGLEAKLESLGEYGCQDTAMYVGKPKIPTAVPIGEIFMVKA